MNPITTITETWSQIEGYSQYSISITGEVKKNDNSMRMKGTQLKAGYVVVSLVEGKKRVSNYVHRLVGRAFVPNPEGKPVIDHIDGNKSNNHAENLRWATISENMQNIGITKRNTSGVKGVCYQANAKKWKATIGVDGKTLILGYYNTIEEATIVRRTKVAEIYGSFAHSCESL